jgi:pantothenate kinase
VGSGTVRPVSRVPAEEDMAEVSRFLSDGGRLLGLAGPPGAGKSTLAARIVAAAPVAAVAVGLDGFHIGQGQLEQLGRSDRKGAPDTFDAGGYWVALRRIQEQSAPVFVPRFDRMVEASLAAEILVQPEHRLVVTEGNYLLVDDEAWRPVGALLDECWYLEVDDAARRRRLVQRHIDHGRSPAAAEQWVARSDDFNADLVARTRERADRIIAIDLG